MRYLPVVLLLVALPALAQDADTKKAAGDTKADPARIALERLVYPLADCPVSSNPLGGEMGKPIELVRKGRLIRICCASCKEEVDPNVDRILASIDAVYKMRQRATYPLTTCPIEGSKLGSKGKPVEVLHGTRLVRLCCNDCVEAFRAKPADSMDKIDAALIAAQRPAYKAATCPVGGEKLGSKGEPVDVLVHTKLVRLCCKDCEAELRKDPAKYLAKTSGAKPDPSTAKKPEPTKATTTKTTLAVSGMT